MTYQTYQIDTASVTCIYGYYNIYIAKEDCDYNANTSEIDDVVQSSGKHRR